MDVNRDYYLLLIDVRGSTQLAPALADDVMARLHSTLKLLRRSRRRDRPLRLRMSYGDEVAALFVSPSRLYDVAVAVRDVLYPDATLRFVVAKGRIAVASRDIRKVGGEVFKRADDAMLRLKRDKRFGYWLLGDPLADAVLNSLTETGNVLLEEMSVLQRQVFALLGQSMLQKDVARALHKSPQSVSSAAKRGKAELVLETERAIRGVLARIDQRDSSDFLEST